MHRRTFLQNTALTFGAMTLAQKGILSSLFEDPWKITMLRNDVGIFEERGGTIAFLLSKKGVVFVDSQFPDQSKHLLDELKKRGEKEFKGIVDHVMAHENSLINQQKTAVINKSEDKQLYPDLTYTDTWQKRYRPDIVSLHYYGAGHTNGDSFVHFEHANIVHCGDLVFNRRHPFVDRTAGANMKSWMEVLNKALAKFDKETMYVFGHAGAGYKVTGTADDLNQFRDYLGNVLKFVEGEIKAGKTKEEVLKTTIIPGGEEWKTDGIKRPLEAAWDELNTK